MVKKIILSKRLWRTEPSEYCILSLHRNDSISDYFELKRYLKSFIKDPDKVAKYFVTIKVFDHLTSDTREPEDSDFETLEELAKELGYEGIEWKE